MEDQMKDVNIVVLSGRVATDVSLKTLPSGSKVADFRLAVNEASTPERLSGLHFVNDDLFITSSGQSDQPDDKFGSVWWAGKASGEVVRLAKFSNLKPEGISATGDDNSLLICFDQGSKHLSQIALLEGVR